MSPTLSQRVNVLVLTARGYAWWRSHSLTLLSGEPFRLEREKQLFLGLAQPQAGERWLDVGTSTGFYAGVLARAGCQVDAIDLSPAMLCEARRREGDAVNWLRLDGEQTGLDAGRYDGVTIGATLNETPDPAAMLREAARLLKPGGRLWLMYVAPTGTPVQRLLARLGHLTFTEGRWVERQVPELTLTHLARFGKVELALLHKENIRRNHAPSQV